LIEKEGRIRREEKISPRCADGSDYTTGLHCDVRKRVARRAALCRMLWHPPCNYIDSSSA